MVKTAKDILIKAEIKPLLAYTFSDEINLLFYKKIDLPFNGKIGRILSLLSSYATSSLQFYLLSLGKAKIFPVFSAQAFKVKSDKKILEYFYWRCSASLRNFLKEYTLKVLGKKFLSLSKEEITKKLCEKGIILKKLPRWEKYGTIVCYRMDKRKNLTQKSVDFTSEKGRKWLKSYLKEK